MEYQFIHTSHSLYPDAVALRIKTFFKGISRLDELIYDVMEPKSLHLVCVDHQEVVGTGRLTFLDREGIISQMAVDQAYRRMGIGREILHQLTESCKDHGFSRVTLNARVSTMEFYLKSGFKPVSNNVFSKSGLIHPKMKKVLS